ncbi:MAG: hypothetical protein ACYTFW_26400 [Planctomycetota bacterium]|jgi:hypothetical protein
MIKQIIIYVILLIAFVVGFFGYLHYRQPVSTKEQQVERVREQLRAFEIQKDKMVSPRQRRAVTGQ